jgi:hypothetical protein
MALSSRRLPSLLRVPVSPVPRSPRYYEGATTSHPRIRSHLWIRFHGPPAPPAFVSAAALPRARRSLPGPGLWVPAARSSGLASGREWDLSGLQAILPVPLLRSTTPVEPMRPRHAGHLGAAPATHTAKASTTADFGANPQLQHSLSTLHERRRRRPCKTRFRLAGSAFAGRASSPLDRYERFQFLFVFILLSCSPDANGLSAQERSRPTCGLRETHHGRDGFSKS